MITRIVKLEFPEEQLEAFLNHFEQVKWSVATFPGCHGMKLIQDVKKQIFLQQLKTNINMYL